MALPEQEIIHQLKGTNTSGALHQLYTLHFDAVIAQVVANSGTEEDGADIFQESVIILLKKVKTGEYRGESRLGTFLHAIARNCWLHELRTRRRREAREKQYSLAEENEAIADNTEKEALYSRNLEKLMTQLGGTCRKLLQGFYYEKKKMRDLLQEFNYENEQVLRNRKSKCMKKLKEMLVQLQSNTAYE